MKASKLGILSALIASSCCMGPLLFILLGLGSLGIGGFLGKYHWYFIAGAVVLIVFAWLKLFKEKKTCNLKGCQMENKKMALIPLMTATLVVAVFVALSVYTYAVQKDYSTKEEGTVSVETKTMNIPVEGMTCFACELTVQAALKKTDGVISAKASAKEEIAHVGYDPSRTDVEQLIEAINKTGYKASLPK